MGWVLVVFFGSRESGVYRICEVFTFTLFGEDFGFRWKFYFSEFFILVTDVFWSFFVLLVFIRGIRGFCLRFSFRIFSVVVLVLGGIVVLGRVVGFGFVKVYI